MDVLVCFLRDGYHFCARVKLELRWLLVQLYGSCPCSLLFTVYSVEECRAS